MCLWVVNVRIAIGMLPSMVSGDEVMLSNGVGIYCLWMSRSISASCEIVDLRDVISDRFNSGLNIL